MQHLSDYITEKQTKLLDKYQVFFAFSKKQLNEQLKRHNLAKEDVVSLINGMLLPKENAQAFLDEHEQVILQGIAQDEEDHTIEQIIHRELDNHEFVITGDITDTVEALEGYNISEQDIINSLPNWRTIREQRRLDD